MAIEGPPRRSRGDPMIQKGTRAMMLRRRGRMRCCIWLHAISTATSKRSVVAEATKW